MEESAANGLPLILVERNSVEWDAISAYLGICAGTSKVQVSSIWRVANADTGFDRRRLDKLTVPCWLPVNDLGVNNKKDDVCRRGFNIGDDGITLRYGSIAFPEPARETAAPENSFIYWVENTENRADKATYDLFFCDVCVGVPYSINSWTEAKYIKKVSLPKDYDSVLITDDVIGDLRDRSDLGNSINLKMVDTKVSNATNEHRFSESGVRDHLLPPTLDKSFAFRIFDASQISAHFLVTVNVYSALKESFGIPICAHCKEKAAEVYCVADQTRLCTDCNDCLHTGTPILSRHLRVPLNQAPPESMGSCTLHRQEECVFYCLICQAPICVLCRNAHLHGRQVDGGEPFVPILDAYHGVLADQEHEKKVEQDQGLADCAFVGETAHILRARKKVVSERLKEINEAISECERVTEDAKLATHRIVQGAVDQLMYWCERNVADTLGLRFSQSRTMQDLQKGAAFMQYLKSVLPPPDFLRHWLQHCRLTKQVILNSDEILSQQQDSTSGAAPPLLKLEGSIMIDSE